MKILLFSNWLPQKSTSSLFTFLTLLFLHKISLKIFWDYVCFTFCSWSYLATWPNSTWYFSFHGIWHLILGTLSNLPAIAFGATISSIFCSCALPLRIYQVLIVTCLRRISWEGFEINKKKLHKYIDIFTLYL